MLRSTARHGLAPLALASLAIVLAWPAMAVTPPSQPSTGPGGSDYPHQAVRSTHLIDGRSRYWLFEPDAPRPSSAPVFVFLSGVAAGTLPYTGIIEFSVFADAYRPMFEHLARKGYTVIFPAYGWIGTPMSAYEAHAVEAVRQALQTLETDEHVSPRADGFAIGGHSFGGLISLSIANRHDELGLPRPRAIVGH